MLKISFSVYPIELKLDIFSVIILLGIFQGFFLVFFFLNKKNRSILSNRLLGLFILILALISFEVWLNYSGYITKIIIIDNFSEPLNFAIAPLLYLYIRTNIKPDFRKKDYFHFLVFILYLFYCFFYYLQPAEFKFNSFLDSCHPNFDRIRATIRFHSDPLGIRTVVNELTAIHITIYFLLTARFLIFEMKKQKIKFWKRESKQFLWLRNILFVFLGATVIFIFVKFYFYRDLGDYFICIYVAFIFYVISFKVINDTLFFFKPIINKKQLKYIKSSLNEDQKKQLLKQLTTKMQRNKYYLNNMASLPDLAKRVGSVVHHVSQVINEKLGKSFFEWLSENRIEEAKRILSDMNTTNITIEELSERVGYNSKSSFNRAFKKHTNFTPSQYRKSLNCIQGNL